MWQLTKAIAGMKPDTEQTMKLEGYKKLKLALSVSWIHGMIAQLVRAYEQNLVVLGSNTTQANFLWLLQRILQHKRNMPKAVKEMRECFLQFNSKRTRLVIDSMFICHFVGLVVDTVK